MILTTERLLLRPLRIEDAEAVAALDADPEVMRYLGGPNGTVESAAAWIVGLAHDPEDTGFWAAEHGGGFLGWLHLRPAEDPAEDPLEDEPPHEMELGYRLRRDAWGRGYATEGCAVLLSHAWNALAAPSVFAVTDEANAASRRLLEKLGLNPTECFALPDGTPVVRYRIMRPKPEG